MRGAGDHLSVGERIAFYRRRRGMTQAVLAGLVGRSEDWLSKVERGDRAIQRLDVLAAVAGALRVTVADLVGAPVLMEDHEERHDDVPAVRSALMSAGRLSKTLFRSPASPVDPAALAVRAEAGWGAYQAGRLGEVVAALPELIRSAQEAESSARPGPSGGWAMSARVHHLAATTLAKLGEGDLSWIAAERSMRAADMSEDALVMASAIRCGVHALLVAGKYEEAMRVGEDAAHWLAAQNVADTAEGASLLGMLRLRSAIAASRNHDRGTTREMLRLAEDSVAGLPADSNLWQTGFNASNVAVHRISSWMELGDHTNVADDGPGVDVSVLPAERRASHMMDVGRALSGVGRDEESLDVLLEAERTAAQLVRHNVGVRETIREMHRRTPPASERAARVRALAERCRAV